MTALLDRIVGVIAGFQSREADLRQRLANALADDAADEAEIAAARSDALTAMERAATAEALMAQLQASADGANSQLTAIDALIDQFVPALTESEANAEEEAAEPVDADAVDSSAEADAGAEADAADGNESSAAGDASGDTTEPDSVGSRLIAMPRRGKDFHRGICFQPTAAVAAAARRALERRAQQPPSQRGMTPVGLARARQLANRQELSPQTIDRMVSYFARHEVDKRGSSWSDYGKGRQAWDGWGGNPGLRWARSIARRMDVAERRGRR